MLTSEYQGKTVLITGGASGIALLCGKNYAERGANVVLADINKEGLQQAKESFGTLADKVLTCVCDVRDYAQVTATRDKAVEVFGSIDILICCAGGSELRILGVEGKEFKDVPIDVFDFGIDLNLKGAFYFNHAVLDQMAKQKSGVIINLGSVTGMEGTSSNIAYAAAKAGIIGGLTPSVAMYGAQYNVRCCCVTPGPVLTRPGMAGMTTLMKRAGEVQEIVNMILFLTSEQASYITGQNFVVDGGRLITFDKTWGKNEK